MREFRLESRTLLLLDLYLSITDMEAVTQVLISNIRLNVSQNWQWAGNPHRLYCW